MQPILMPFLIVAAPVLFVASEIQESGRRIDADRASVATLVEDEAQRARVIRFVDTRCPSPPWWSPVMQTKDHGGICRNVEAKIAKVRILLGNASGSPTFNQFTAQQ